MWTLRFWQQAFERAVKTAAQSAILILGADQIDIAQANLQRVAVFAAGGAVLSLLTSVASLPFGPAGTPSLVNPQADPAEPQGIMRP